jgi:hypothetical protein
VVKSGVVPGGSGDVAVTRNTHDEEEAAVVEDGGEVRGWCVVVVEAPPSHAAVEMAPHDQVSVQVVGGGSSEELRL